MSLSMKQEDILFVAIIVLIIACLCMTPSESTHQALAYL